MLLSSEFSFVKPFAAKSNLTVSAPIYPDPLVACSACVFCAMLAQCYQLAAQGDKNCTPFKLTECSAPLWTPAAADMCSSFDAYYGCIHESGCFEKSDLDHCTAHEANLGCALQCHEKYTLAEKGYETIVDLSGFSYGKGVYKNLFGVNLLSAFGALCLFIFACG